MACNDVKFKLEDKRSYRNVRSDVDPSVDSAYHGFQFHLQIWSSPPNRVLQDGTRYNYG